ncbi:MAG: carboxypeptidase regulatory-like domain-containing protein [Peptococcaceae bacterium]|nr:carboxypeptidase regulatory-like domain-containing protein [Peptococcaceae bacterium]
MKGKLLATLLILFLSIPAAASAHGAKISYQITKAIEITATYDTGEPLSGGQVTIYAPDNPSTPWRKAKCDENGKYIFIPDPSKPGTWDVQVRQAGHGDMIHIPIGEGTAEAASGSTGYTPLQIVLMAACVVWGFVGTTLFFARRRGS